MKTEDSSLIGINSIVQVVAEGDWRWRLMVVRQVVSWGVIAEEAHAAGKHSLSWESIEVTGGALPFNRDGKRVGGVAPVETKVRHHP